MFRRKKRRREELSEPGYGGLSVRVRRRWVAGKSAPFLYRHEGSHSDHSYDPHDVPLDHFSVKVALAKCATSSGDGREQG